MVGRTCGRDAGRFGLSPRRKIIHRDRCALSRASGGSTPDLVSRLIGQWKANPGKINIASPGVGTPMHVAAAVSEILPGFEASARNRIGAPKAPPAAIIDKLSANITAGLAATTLKARFTDVGGETVPMPSAGFASSIVEETEKWAKVVRFSGAKVN